MSCISICSTMSPCTFMRVRYVSLVWDMLLLNQVLRRLSVEKLLSEDATDIGRHMQSFISFSASPKRDLVWGWSSDRPDATSCTVLWTVSLKTPPNIWSCSCSRPSVYKNLSENELIRFEPLYDVIKNCLACVTISQSPTKVTPPPPPYHLNVLLEHHCVIFNQISHRGAWGGAPYFHLK